MSSHKPIRIYMGFLILCVNTWYRLFCFFKLFPMVGKGLTDDGAMPTCTSPSSSSPPLDVSQSVESSNSPSDSSSNMLRVLELTLGLGMASGPSWPIWTGMETQLVQELFPVRCRGRAAYHEECLTVVRGEEKLWFSTFSLLHVGDPNAQVGWLQW